MLSETIWHLAVSAQHHQVASAKASSKQGTQRGLHVLVAMKLTSDANMVADVSSLLAVPCIQVLHVVTDKPYLTELPGARYHYLPPWLARVRGLRALVRVPLLMRLCKRERIDVVLGFHLTSYGVAALAAAHWFRIPCAVHLLGNDLDVYCRNRLLGPLLMRLAAQADMLTAQGSRSAATLRSYGQKRVAVIPTVCSLPTLAEESLAERVYDIVYVGRFSSEKRPDRFVRVVERIAMHRPKVRALMLGSGPMDAAVRHLIAACGLGKVIEVVGWTNRVGEYLRTSRVFLLTSDNDQLPLALLEAMTAGAVPVACDVGNICDVVDEKTGFLVPRDDIGAYAVGVCALLDDENLRQCKASSSQARVRGSFSVEANVRRWTEVIGTMVRDDPSASAVDAEGSGGGVGHS